jgi:hypothetical protein
MEVMPKESLIGLNRLSNHNAQHREAIIIGDGPGKRQLLDVPEDQVLRFIDNKSVAAINRAGIDWPYRLEYWCTYHAEWISRWYADRELKGYLKPYKVIVSANKRNKIDHIDHYNITAQVQGLNSGGTSTLMAAMYLLDIGYNPIHLYGCDLTKSYSKDRKFWRILKGEPLIFHGSDWFQRGIFQEEE